ncbi:MAG: hypothetical protein MI802_17270 [Desulfobacterales bacterium]|nr:hypothetical protein [Desulfobacterales bacterium]
MTVSTGGDDPWSAPVYYLYRDNCFFFFSSPESRHIKDGAGNRCAASLFEDSTDITQLRGIQMSGRIESSGSHAKAARTAVAYARRFGLKTSGGNAIDFFKTHYRAGLYRFVPEEIYYMDNRRGFAQRVKIDL